MGIGPGELENPMTTLIAPLTPCQWLMMQLCQLIPGQVCIMPL